jgi:predicted dinucleotide-binding enzyme
MKIGIIGSGTVALTLARGLVAGGHVVTLGTRDPAKLAADVAATPGLAAASVEEAARFADLAILAVKGTAAADALRLAAGGLDGKTVIDACNPIADAPPDGHVLRYFTGPNDSLAERLQRDFPRVRLVKALNSVGAARMVQPRYAEGRPTMFIAGDDAPAKAAVVALLDELGWESADMGGIVAARAIEPLCQLWCINGLAHGEWTHAFKVLHDAA